MIARSATTSTPGNGTADAPAEMFVGIISNAFTKSEWCQWEVDIIQERRRRQGRDAVLIIMLKTITSRHMTSPLRTLLDSTSHLRYKKGVGEDLFWKAVTEGVRKPIGHSPISEL
jgi:hypothetical protein